jgi:hypothetical protein
MPTSFTIFDIIRWLMAAALLAGVVSGIGTAGLFLIRRTQPNRWSNWLFAGLLGAMSLTLFDLFVVYLRTIVIFLRKKPLVSTFRYG